MEDPFKVLKEARVIAVVGASRNPNKDAGMVPAYLKSKGYKIIPINPVASEILGEKAYPSLLDIPDDVAREIDVIDVFRPPNEAVKIVEQAAELSRRTGKRYVIWFQYGTYTEEAVRLAEEKGLRVVYNNCMMEAHKKLERLEEG